MATTGIRPENGQRLVDGRYVRAAAHGQNRNASNRIVATPGGTKAAAFQMPAGVALLQILTCATNGDSVLAPAALEGNTFKISNSGAATVSIYGRGTDTINGAATANNYDLATNVSAEFFCPTDGQWKAIKSA